MAKKIRFTRKDTYLIIVGILFSFMIQSIYDAFREWMDIGKLNNVNQFFLLLILAVVFSGLSIFVLRNVEEK